MSPATILLLLFIIVPLAEIGVFIQVGDLIGLWPTLALIVLTAVIGSICIRFQGFKLINRARAQLDAGEPPVFEVISGVCLVVAGVLLLTPGFVTDTVGFILLFPPARRLLYERVLERRLTIMASGGGASGGGAGGAGKPGPGRPGAARPGGGRPVVIEGEFEPLDDDGTMPPPRGSWDKPS